MDYTAIFTGFVCLVLGAVSTYFLTIIVSRANGAKALAAVENARDIALATVKERDEKIIALNTSDSNLTAKLEVAAASINQLRSENGRLQGEQASLDSIKRQLDERNRRVDDLNKSLTALESTKASLTALNQELEASKVQAIGAAETRLRATLAEKDVRVKEMLDAAADYHRRESAERERSLAERLAMAEANLTDKRKLLDDAEKALLDKFSTVSIESLKSASEDFLRLANERFEKAGEVSKAELEKRQTAIDQLVKPVAETLAKLEAQQVEMEAKRLSAFDEIEKGIRTLSADTDQLANALRKPITRGNWGENTLRKVLVNASLIEGIDFDIQDSTEGEEGRLRTDVVIHLPNGRDIVIDSKAPLEDFWNGMNAPDEATRLINFASHARLVREHMKTISSKSYWKRYDASPDCTIMFLPTEGAYLAATESDPQLLLDGQKMRVYLANPGTLVNILHLSAYILKEERLRQNSLEVQKAGTELYKRLSTLVGYLADTGKSLGDTVNRYNKTVSSLNSRLVPSARRMSELGIGEGAEMTPIQAVEAVPSITFHDELREALPKNDDAGLMLDSSLSESLLLPALAEEV